MSNLYVTDPNALFLQQYGKSVRGTIDSVLVDSPSGPIYTAIGDTLFGINHRQTPNALPINRELYGLTFFTRPLMNLQTENLRAVRKFAHLLTTNPRSYSRAIRCYLDGRSGKYGVTCPFVDPQQAFISILTNTLISISGGPDTRAPVYENAPGLYKETTGHIDGVSDIYTSYNATCNFYNLVGNPIVNLFQTWVDYGSYLFRGDVNPYPDLLIDHAKDYDTRIYRLTLDPTKRFIQQISATGAAFPTGVQTGHAFNYERDTPLNQGNNQISIEFQCFGMIYNDVILFKEFNDTVVYYNAAMSDSNRESMMIKIPAEFLGIFKNVGYPRANALTRELEWWVDPDTYRYYIPDGEDNELANTNIV